MSLPAFKSPRQPRPALRALVLALGIASALPAVLAFPGVAQAQTATANFRIPAGPLASALLQFGRESGLMLSYSAADVEGRQSPGVNGAYRPAEALAALLSGTGLAAQRLANGSYALRPAAQVPVSTLAPIEVAANPLSSRAWGPVDGFVAGYSMTGTKTDTPLIETPQSISVVTRDQMTWQAIQKTEQALRYEAGVRAELADDLRHQNITVRGFSVAASNQGIYLDGLALATRYYGSYDVNPYALERVEVLRGPASLLYGQNQPGGIVNQVSKRPTETPLHEVEFTTGDPGRAQLGFDFSGPVTEDGQWLYRLTGQGRNADTEVDTVRDKRAFIAPSFTWQPSAATHFTVLTNFQRIRAGSTDQWLPSVGTLTPTPYGRISRSFFSGEPDFDRYDKDQAMLGYLFEHKFNDSWTVRQNARYNQNRTHYRALISELGWGTLPDGEPDYQSLQRYAFSSDEKARTLAVDTQVQYQGRTGAFAHTVLLGLDYQQSSFDTQLGFGMDGVPPINPFNPVYGYQIDAPPIYNDTFQRMRQLGLYAQDQVKIMDKLVVTAGGRMDWSEASTRNNLTGTRTQQNDNAFTGRIGMVYLSDTGLAPYVSYATSFRPQAGTTFAGTPFRPTKGEQYEAGVKLQPKGFDSFITASVFQIEQRNVLTRDPEHANSQVQTGKVRSEGFELQGKASLASNLDIVGSYTYTDITTVSSNYPEQIGKVPFAGVPAHMASLWVDYTIDTGPLAGLGFGAGARYLGTTYSDLDNAVKVPSVTLADAAIRYDLGRASPAMKGATLSLNASNLFDKAYVASCNNVNLCFYGPGRVVLATLRYNW
ncbi:TonB-dependent siderophore receptor [Achromobacter spanius]|uniref:TonB-dependent siderophore receptor n=1 Tax=Achromobacter spanius TaxID=217203 RepID=UPI0037F70C79